MVGEAPYWYLVIRVAKYIGMNPIDVMRMPSYWLHAALAVESAEGKAQEWHYKQRNLK